MTRIVSYSPRYTYLSCVGKAFNSKEGEGSLDGGVKFIGSTFGEIGFDAQFTANSTI